MEAPLAERIRPQHLEDYISQSHLVGPNGSLTQQISKGIIPSLIFWGLRALVKLLWRKSLHRNPNVLFIY